MCLYAKVSRWSTSVIEVCWHMGILKHAKEELAWAIDKWLQFVINVRNAI